MASGKLLPKGLPYLMFIGYDSERLIAGVLAVFTGIVNGIQELLRDGTHIIRRARRPP